MDWLLENWFWVVIFAVFIGMHLFGHGGHSSHGSGCGGHDHSKNDHSKEGDHHHNDDKEHKQHH